MRYEKLTPTHIDSLRAILDPARVHVGEAISEDYSHDELAYDRLYPDVLVEPISTMEVAQVLRFSYQHHIPIVPRGTGTGLCGGAVALHGGIMLSMARMNRILEIDQDNRMAVVEPGVILLEFQKTVEEMGLFYPPDPGEKSATLGGNVMTNAGGMRAVRYGVTRDYVLGMEAVIPGGEIIHLGGKVLKNSSGYSLKDLLIGSEGTLAVVTKLILKLLPRPLRQVSLLVPFPDLDQAIDAVPRIMGASIIPTAIEFMQREVIQAAEKYLGKPFPDSSAPAYLLLAFYGNSIEELTAVHHQAAHVCLASGALDVLIADTQERQEMIWEARGAFLEALKGMSEIDEVDVVVPPAKVAQFIKFTRAIAQDLGARILSFGHAGDGNIHVYILRDGRPQDEWRILLGEAMDRMYREARDLEGQVSGEHGIGLAKIPYLQASLGDAELHLLRGIKQVFDPKGLLNPGKVVR
ncbi:MAG: FAD-binding oxidoreductase [Limnochordia bacterium]|jgi:glycolate oxidase